jgi:hypothetical protein
LKIYIKLQDGKSFTIPAPMVLVKMLLGLGGFGTFIAHRFVPEEQKQYIDCIDFRELSKSLDILKAYKGLAMVDVKSKDGVHVKVSI